MENKGNPYHDESGKFTSKEGQGIGGGKEKPTMPEIENISNLFNDIMSKAQDFINRQKEREKSLVEESTPKKPDNFRQMFSDTVAAERKMDQLYGFNSSNEEMAESIVKRMPQQYGSRKELYALALQELNDLDETDKWKKRGYKERMFDIPSSIEIETPREGYTIDVDIDTEDILNYLKDRKIEISEEQLEDLEYNRVLPYDMFDEDTLDDFKEYIKNSSKMDDYDY